MIKIKFKMNNYKHSESFFKWIEMQENFKLHDFPMSWRLTHAYLYGLLFIYRNEP
jgi:hypothetical protein